MADDDSGAVAWIGLGANLGDDPRAALREAAASIATWPGSNVLAVSRHWCSAPVDAQGPDFFNAVLKLRTVLSPEQVLDRLLALELAHGRERPYRNAPRTLDLDLLLHGDTVLDTARLQLPHPRMHERAFVLRPLAEVAGEGLVIPGRGALSALLPAVRDQRIDVLAA